MRTTLLTGRSADPDTTNTTTSYSFASDFPFSTGLLGVDQKSNFLYTDILIITFCVVVILTFFLRWTELSLGYLRHISVISNPDRQVFWSKNRTHWWPWLKKNIVYAPLWRNRHNREMQLSRAVSIGTLPSRGHMTLLFTFAACNLAYCLALPYSESTDVIWASLRGRSGILAALNMIPTILFALRNNPLIGILHVPYDTFNLLHRWLGRITTVEAVLHTVAWYISTVRFGGVEGVGRGLTELPHGPSYVWGLVGTVALIVICIQAWSPLRHAFYETFLNAHRIMVAIAIVGVYLHLKIDNLPQVPWLQACFSLWIIEYGVRCFWIIRYNVSLKKGITHMTIEALPAEACRVTCQLTRPWRSRAGCHAHIYVPAISLWASHPFSVAWTDMKPIEDNISDSDCESQKSPNMRRKHYPPGTKLQATASFVMRARTGMTRRLYDAAMAQPDGVLHTWGFVEGPYGGFDSLASYGTLLLFAGGVGVTHQVPYIRDLIQGYTDGTTGTKKIILIWTVPNTESLEWVRPWMDEILRMSGRKDVLKIQLFVTRPRNNREVQSGSGSVQMFPGRCNPQTILDREIEARQGAMAVTVCGPGAFADDVRAAVRKRVDVGVVDFIEEAFTY